MIEYIKNRLSSALDEAEITFDLRKISVADVYYTGSGKLTDLLQKAIFNKTNIDPITFKSFARTGSFSLV